MEKIKQVSEYRFDWTTAALHYDKSIVRDIIYAILRQSLMDWNNVGDNPYVFQSQARSNLYRAEVVGFFNSDWFETILNVYFPDCTQQSVCREIKKKQRKYKPCDLVSHTWETRPNGKKGRKVKHASI